MAGLVCRVEVPDYPTRLTILTQQAREAGAVIPEGVLHLIADSFHKNVRELSGALVRVVAFASLLKEPRRLPLATSPDPAERFISRRERT